MDKKKYENDIVQSYLVLKKTMQEKNIDYATDIFNLYITYDLLQRKFKGNAKLMDEYENKIYTVNGKILKQYERIELELDNLTGIINNINFSSKNITENDIKQIYSLIMNIKVYKNYTDDKIKYYKKELSIYQAKLGIPNKFLSATYEVFNDLKNDAVMALIEQQQKGGVNSESVDRGSSKTNTK